MKYILWGILLYPQLLFSQIHVTHKPEREKDFFPIVKSESTATIVYDGCDEEVVKRVSQLFADDITRVTGRTLTVVAGDKSLNGNLIIIGTIGKNKLIDELIRQNKLDVDPIKNQWERFAIQTVRHPFKGVSKALVIAGSDKRGTAYGVFTLSQKMGVSPWYWWADVPVQKKDELYVKNLCYISNAPTVKYRGVFLNDEDWGLHPWAAAKLDTESGTIGPNTYERVFELLLRLKANMVAPAMHECTKAFYTVAGNMEMADKYGIMITTSHCEPLLYNNASEWDKAQQGEWNYVTNKSEIRKTLDARVKQACQNENIYTIALRGMHDEGMKGGSDEEKLQALTEAIHDQRGILEKYIPKPITDIPQIFVPYKEVLNLYEKGLKVPEDITIVWPDDNYGYIKRLSNKEEQKRQGGSGVYYHLSYLGWPNDYLWLNTTPPALMFAEMQKAYSLGANKYWLLNVGDIKPDEMGMQLFLDMAWDFDQFTFENINHYQVGFLTTIYGTEFQKDLEYILDRYYYHGFTRKPEYMTWDWRWNSLSQFDKIKDTEFSFVNYGEAESRLADYCKISEKSASILASLPEEMKPSFFELVHYPVKGASLYNHEMLIGQKNRWYAGQGRSLTNTLANNVGLYHDSLAVLTAEYNNLLDGKWQGMMTAPGFLPEVQLSPTQTIEIPNISELGIFVDGCNAGNVEKLMFPEFNNRQNEVHYFEVYNKGAHPFQWRAAVSDAWIKLDVCVGEVTTQARIHVSIDWDKAPELDEIKGEINVTDGTNSATIQVAALRVRNDLKNVFFPNDGIISISPAEFHRKTEKGDVKFQVIGGLGYSNACLQLGNAQFDDGEGSFVEYDFYTTKPGEIVVNTYMLPLFSKDKAHSTRYGVQVDDSILVEHKNDVPEYSNKWAANLIRNSAINKTTIVLEKPGVHTLKIHSIDPGMIIQKIVVDAGGMNDSYLGPRINTSN